MVLALQPDALKLARAHALSVPEVAALIGQRLHANDLPSAPDFPCARLQNITTTEVTAERGGWGLFLERIQVDSWGVQAFSWEQARLVAVTLRAAMSTLPGVYTGGTITSVVGLSGLAAFTDPDVGKAGYRFDVGVYAHPRQ